MSQKLTLCLISLISFVSAFGKTETDGGVLVLNEQNFLLESMSKSWFLVEFYAPWCGHCQKLEPVVSEAAKMLQLHSPMMHIGKINADANPTLKAEYGIQSFPTFVIFKNGNYLQQYEGPQSAKGIYNEVVKANQAQLLETDCKVLQKMKKANKEQYTAIYFGPKDHPFYEGIYLPFHEYIMDDAQAQKVRLHVRHSSDEKCAEEMQVGYPSIMWYKPFGDKLQEYKADQPANFTSFEAWMQWQITPEVFKLTEYSDLTMGLNKPTMILFRADKMKDEDFAIEFQDAAFEIQQKIPVYMAYTNMDDSYSERLATFFNIDRTQLPQMRLSAGGTKFKPDFLTKNATNELIVDFLKDVYQGKNQAYQREQREPKYNDGHVKILRTTNLYEFLEIEDTDKFVMFWQPDGKNTDGVQRPLYWQIAEDFAAKGLTGKGKVLFAEFNMLENENTQFNTNLIMDLFYFKHDMKTMEYYSATYKELSGYQYIEFACTKTDRLNCPELAKPEEKKEGEPEVAKVENPLMAEAVEEQKTEEAVKSEL